MAYDTSRQIWTTLATRKSDLTRRVILDAALHALERGSVDELTVRAVAKHGNLSERTIFRYFPTREDFLDGIADEVRAQLALPAPPATLEAILAAPRALYAAFEAKKSLTLAALHTELFHRMRETQAKLRWKAVGKLVDSLAPKKSERERRIATANIRYFLAASTWHYYRFYFRFSLEESIACAETAIRQALSGVGVKA